MEEGEREKVKRRLGTEMFHPKVGDVMVVINGVVWDIVFVNPNSEKLRRSDGSITVGMTENLDDFHTVYLSNVLHGKFLRRVLCHELVHCFMFSYSIHISMQEEEYIADWVATYGTELIGILDDLMRNILRRIA